MMEIIENADAPRLRTLARGTSAGGAAGGTPAELRQRLEAALTAPLRGTIETEAPLARHTWFRVGGPAEILFTPADESDLGNFLAALPREVRLTVLGIGSNVLVRDGGIRGAVVRLARPFSHVSVRGTVVTAMAGTAVLQVARAAQRAELAGLEFLSGIPGSIGGALRMNAGAFGGEIKDVLISARFAGRDGIVREIAASKLGLSYRHSAAPEDRVYLSARLQGHAARADEIFARMNAIRSERGAAQPQGIATGGSTFKNPPNTNAWRLIETAGGRDLRVGAAVVSSKHCNFLVNEGGATAAELEALGEEVRRRVAARHGVNLEWEIRILGDPDPRTNAMTPPPTKGADQKKRKDDT